MTAPLLTGRAVVRRDRFTLDLELTLERGERLAVIGRNGSGKSTLAGTVVGLVHPAADITLALHGHPLHRLAPERRRVGYLAQDSLLFPHLSVRDNLAFALTAGAGRTRRRRAYADALAALKEVDAAQLAHAHPSELSGGERQRIALARALATEPELLVLDEPFAALDVDAAAGLRELVADRVARRGIALLLVSHNLVDVVRLTDRAIVVENGTVAEALTTEELRRAPATSFAASFAGLAQVAGEVDARGFTARNWRLALHAGIECRADSGAALLVAGPDEVELLAPDAADPGAVEDEITALLGAGTTLTARLASGLQVRLPTTSTAQPGDRVRVVVRYARVITAAR